MPTSESGFSNMQANQNFETEVEERYLIVGLGNPGRRYQGNRHNIGYMVLNQLAKDAGISLNRLQQKALVGTGLMAGRRIILAKPQTFMNLSGDSVGLLMHYYKISLSNLLVIYDEIDLPFGAIRIREQGGSGGHNGMKSIIKVLGSDFSRLRLGVGRPAGKMDPAAYVLQDFYKEEIPVVDEMIAEAIAAVTTFLVDGIELSMTRHNTS